MTGQLVLQSQCVIGFVKTLAGTSLRKERLLVMGTGLYFSSAILQLLQALSRQLHLTIGRLLSLLDESVQYDDALAYHETVERAAYACPTAWFHFIMS